MVLAAVCVGGIMLAGGCLLSLHSFEGYEFESEEFKSLYEQEIREYEETSFINLTKKIFRDLKNLVNKNN